MNRRLRELKTPLKQVIDKFKVSPFFEILPDGDSIPCQSCLVEMDEWQSQCVVEVEGLKKMSSFFGRK
jgi:hypothetical protein